jgi:non-specific serine/threonine protein kinase
VKWLELCDAEHANLRAALDWLVESREVEWALRLSTALMPFWQARAHVSEGRDRMTQVLALADPNDTSELRARAWNALGTLYYALDEPERAASIHSTRVEPLYRALGDRRGIAVALNAIGVCHRGLRNYEAAASYFEQAMSIWRELGDDQAVARTLSNLAAVAFDQGEHNRARQLYRQVRSSCDTVGDPSGAAWACNFEAEVEHARGDGAAARALYADALARFRRIHDTWGAGDSLLALGHMAIEDRDSIGARRHFEEAHRVFESARDIRGTVRVIEGLARLAAADRQPARALRLAGAAAAVRQTMSMPSPRAEREALERALDVARDGADAHEAGAAWMEGWSLSAQEAVEYAMGS